MRTIPERNRSAQWLLVSLVAALVQLPLFNRSLVALDEGQLTVIASRLLQGDVLYRDIYTGLFPGIYWLAASLFSVFGADVLVLRIAQVVVNALIAGALFSLARPLAGAAIAWVAPLGFLSLVVVSFPVSTMFGYSSVSLLAALAALLTLRRFVDGASPAMGVLAGVLLAICAIVKQNFGGLALVSMAVALPLVRREGAMAQRSWWFPLAWPVAGGLMVASLAAGCLVLSSAWPEFLEYTLVTLFHTVVQAPEFDRALPPVFGAHPAGDGQFLFLYSPSGLYTAADHGLPGCTPRNLAVAVRVGYGAAYLALASIPLLVWRFFWDDSSRRRVAARLMLPFAGLFVLGIFPYPIWSHLVAIFPPLLVVIAMGISALVGALPLRAGGATRLGGAVVAGVALVGSMVSAMVVWDVVRSYRQPMGLPGISTLVSERELALYSASTEFLRSCANPGEAVLVTPDMPLLYLTAGVRNPTPYDLIIPGDVRDDLIVARVDEAAVKCIVFNPAMYVQFAPFEELFPHLNRYMAENFEVSGSVEVPGANWQFLRRREGRVE